MPAVLTGLIFALVCLPLVAQHTIVLRDLTVQRGLVDTLDKKSLRFTDGRELGWDQLLHSNLSGQQSEQFHSFVNSVGLPLFRARERLARGDWYALHEIAEPLYNQLIQDQDSFNDRAKYLICLAAMRGRINTATRPAAVPPFLRACEIRQQTGGKLTELAGFDLNASEIKTTLTTSILPVWFDRNALATTIDQLQRTLKPDLGENSNGHVLYLASMLLQGKDVERARKLVDEIARRDLPSGWQQILQAQLAIASGKKFEGLSNLQKEMHNFSDELRAAAYFILGTEQGKDKNDADLAVLNLLRIPALYPAQMESLSAAAIYEAINILNKNGQSGEAVTLRKELLDRYPSTYHGRLLKAEKKK